MKAAANKANKGYDAAQERREEDDLDRWRFAAEIVEVVLATPSDWSARIGIFGKWGEGKTTVLQFAEQMLTEKESVAFWFSPWAIQSWNDLWEDFGNRLMEALTNAKIPFDGSWRKTAKDSARWLESSGLGKMAETAATVLGKEKLYNAAFGAISRWLKYDGAQIRAIRDKLQDRRLVVLIDDLDRCAPDLVPQLLLSLRELLDLPGFTFLLAFDDEIVGRALTEINPAWRYGSDFLQKILDFRFHLPPITEQQKKRFISKAVTKYCDFVPQESVESIFDLLPNNPRKLKSLIRSLAALRPQVARHDAEELNWADMWLAQMLRLESYPFFEKLLGDNVLEKIAGNIYIAERAWERNHAETKDKDKNKNLKELIKEAGVEDPLAAQRLIQLIEAVRSRASLQFRYVCQLAMRPHAVTWREFRQLYEHWCRDQKPSLLATWMEQHSRDRAVSVDDVDEELFDATIRKRNDCLSAAAESASLQEHEAQIKEAGKLLEMVQQHLLDLGKLEPSRFSKIYGQAQYWIGFRKNQADKSMREKEEKLLLTMVSTASRTLATELFEVLIPESWEPGIEAGVSELKQALREKCLELTATQAAQVAISFITRDGGIRSLGERGRFSAVKYCLFKPDSPVWRTDLLNTFVELILKGQADFTIYVNVRDFSSFLAQGLEHRLDWATGEDIKAILSNEAFVESLWKTVTSRKIQYRMQISFIRDRQSMIHNGVPERLLPLTEELQQRLKELSLPEPHVSGSGPT